ncbi:hypothetical protein V1477_016036 [Vespula maculifrons]|uniref:Uncharacterized protein n=1 Tax=Vespula maculifrons TaxID=7453 RepID=A0ABD2BC02_VESMC
MTKETNDKSCFWLLLRYDDDDDNDDDDDEDNDDDDDDDEESWGTQTYSAQFPILLKLICKISDNPHCDFPNQ